MVIEIWIKENDIENLKALISRGWFSENEDYVKVRYRTYSYAEHICIHIGINDYTRLKDHNLLIKTSNEN